MKTLYIMRHAKASWENQAMSDFDRPLLEKGKKRTKKILDFLQKKFASLDLILSSPATRALETAKIMAHGLGLQSDKVQTANMIYSSDAEQLDEVFFDLPDTVESLMIVGHNPAITGFVNSFIERKYEALPTSTVACLSFDTDTWSNLREAPCKLKYIIYPKMLD